MFKRDMLQLAANGLDFPVFAGQASKAGYMLSANYAVACLAKITDRFCGAKHIGLCLMLQTGRPSGSKETVVILHGIVCSKDLS